MTRRVHTMSNTVLIDSFVSSNNLENLNDYAAHVLSKIEKSPTIQSHPQTDIIKHLFSDVYQSVKPFLEHHQVKLHALNTGQNSFSRTKAQEQNVARNISGKTLVSIRKVLENFKDGVVEDPTMDPSLIELQKLIFLYSSIAIVMATSNFLLQSCLTILDDINYYDCVLNSRTNIIVYTVQTLPQNFLKLVNNLSSQLFSKKFNEENLANVTSVPAWLPHFFHSSYRKTIHYLKLFYLLIRQNTINFLRSPTSFILEKQQQSNSLAKQYLASIFGLPFYFSKVDIQQRRNALMELQYLNVQKIGFLINEIPSFKIDSVNEHLVFDFSIIHNLKNILSVDSKLPVPLPNTNSIATDTLPILNSLYSKLLPNFIIYTNNLAKQNSQPSILVKTWPLIIPSIIYVPSIVNNIVSNREYLYNWIQNNLIDTTYAFYKNWIIKPLSNIFATIRHDDNSRIALMSHQSLNSDLESLERMVIEYTLDSQPALIDNSTNKEELISKIKRSVQSGDLSIVMQNYEHDIRSPLKSLLAGDMIRNLLIQVQKTKVDGTLALSGIDKMLKSQELVFGVVAASPSLLVVWWLIQYLRLWLREGYLGGDKGRREIRVQVRKALGSLERLIDEKISYENNAKDYYRDGLLFIEVNMLRREGLKVLPNYLKSEWVRDLGDVMDHKGNIKFKLLTVQRMWNLYGNYLKG